MDNLSNDDIILYVGKSKKRKQVFSGIKYMFSLICFHLRACYVIYFIRKELYSKELKQRKGRKPKEAFEYKG